MKNVYDIEGLPFSNKEDRAIRTILENRANWYLGSFFAHHNPTWNLEYIEAPMMIPSELLNIKYEDSKVFKASEFTLRPETTETTYAYARKYAQEPYTVYYQHSKSARPDKARDGNIYFKEFYQLEYQGLYPEDDETDYHSKVLPSVQQILSELIELPIRQIESPEQPAYATRITDFEVLYRNNWIEVASVLTRTDSQVEISKKLMLNLEIGFGTDRIVEIIGAI